MLNIAADLLLPPAGLAMLAFFLLKLGRWRLGVAAVGLLLLLGMPAVASILLHLLDPPAEPLPVEPPQAIVVLSGDGILQIDPATLAQTGLDPGLLTLDRLRAGAALHRRTGLPILVSGGPDMPPESLAAMMVRSLRDDFRVDVRWTENRSNDTWQNAEFSAAILREAGVSRIYLVTQAWHLRRGLLAFRHFGMQATPAPGRWDNMPQYSLFGLVPRASAWQSSFYALHEAVGLVVYSLRR